MTDMKQPDPKQIQRTVVQGRVKMTPSEAFVETLVAQGVTDVFGIVGSAYMDALDIFPAAGIRFIPVAHEQGAVHMADGYSRVSGRHGVCIGQNGPGVTNFVTGVAAAYWAHSPVVVITPETGSMTIGLGGFQETEQLPIFSKITKYQGHVMQPEAHGRDHRPRCFDRAMLEMGPTQLNIPRDFFYGEIECEIPQPIRIGRGAGDEHALDEAAKLLAEAKFPVILAGGGVIMAGGTAEAVALAELLHAPVACSYLHNDAFPASHPLWVRPARLPGLEGGDEADREGRRGARARHAPRALRHAAAVRPGVLAGERQDHPDRRRREDARPGEADLGRHLRRRPRRGGGARCRACKGKSLACQQNRDERDATIKAEKDGWEKELEQWTHETDPYSVEISKASSHMHPRQMLRELEKAMPKRAMVSTDIGNICSVSESATCASTSRARCSRR